MLPVPTPQARVLYLGAMIGFFFYSTQYLQGVLGFAAFQAGVAFFPMTVVNFAVAMTIPRLTARLGQAVPPTAGVVPTMAGMAWLAARAGHHARASADDDQCMTSRQDRTQT